MPGIFLIEAAVTSFEDALAVESRGVDRVEFCGGSLDAGGTTPDMPVLAACITALRIPVHVLIRPRTGDFVYTADELSQMRRDIATAKTLGAAGVAVGALTPDGGIDLPAIEDLIAHARPMRVCFHRAFDQAPDQFDALEQLVTLGVDYVLTSGAAPTAAEGAGRIHELVAAAKDRITIVAAGSIRPENVSRIVRQTGVTQVHGRAVV